MAARADSDRAAADRLQAFVEAQHANPGTEPTRAQPTNGAKVQAIVAQITTLADVNEPQPFQAFTPTKSLSNSVTYDGFTLTLDTNASTQFYGIELSGNGVQAFSKHFGPSAGAGGGNALPPGVTISTGIADNNEAIDAITITQNVATADSASVSSSSAGSINASEVNARSSSITFLVNYATGEIGVQQSAVSVSAQSIKVASPGSTLSTLACTTSRCAELSRAAVEPKADLPDVIASAAFLSSPLQINIALTPVERPGDNPRPNSS